MNQIDPSKKFYHKPKPVIVEEKPIPVFEAKKPAVEVSKDKKKEDEN